MSYKTDQFFFFPGNHDLYYKDKRDIHSVEFGKYIPGVTVIHHPTTIDDVTLCPWLIGDEWKTIAKQSGFKQLKSQRLTFGIVSLYTAIK